MKKRIALFTIVCLLFVTFPVTAAETGSDTYTLTMKEAVDLTLKNSPDLQMVDVYVGLAERAMLDSRNMRDDLNEGINATLQGAHQKINALEMQKQALKQQMAQDPTLIPLNAPKIAALEVAQQGVVYSLGAVDLMKDTTENIKKLSERAEEGYDDARQTRKDADKKAGYGTEKLYLAMLSLDDFIKLQEDNVKLQRELTELERLKYQNGFSTAVQVDKAAEKVMEEEKRLNDLKNTRLLLTYQMNRNIGREWNAPLQLVPVGFQPVQTEQVEIGYQKALDAALVILQHNRTIDNKKEDLHNSGTNSDELAKVKLEIKKTEIDLQDTQFKMKKTLEDLNYKVADAKKKLTDCKQKYETAQKDYEHVLIAYEHGMSLKVQVNGSKILMNKAYNEYIKAVYDYYLAARELQLGEEGIYFE